MENGIGQVKLSRHRPKIFVRRSLRRKIGAFEVLESRMLLSASSINGKPFIDLGPSDNVALDQPRVTVELITPAQDQSVGPGIFNSWLLDTGANTILTFQTAINDMNETPPRYTTNGFFEEVGVGGFSLYDLSTPYRFDFAGTSGERNTILNTKLISDGTRDLSIFGPWGIVGMPAMTQRLTSFDFSVWSDPSSLELFMRTEFPATLPAATTPRYSIPVDNRIEFFPEPHVIPAGLAPPAWADVPFLTGQLKHNNNVFTGNMLFDTGAQVSIMSSAVAISLGLDSNLDGVLDNRDANFAREETIGGIGGLVTVPVFLVDEVHVPTTQGPDLVWTDLQWLVVDIAPGLDVIFGFDNMTSGWIEAFSGGGRPGYILQSYLDFRNYEATGRGTINLDINPDLAAIVDPNGPGAVVSELGNVTTVSESGLTDTYQIALSQPPTANVRINLTPAVGNQIRAVSLANPANTFLDFTPANWNIPQTVLVSAIQDSTAESLHRSYVKHVSSSTDTRYQNVGMPRVTVNVIDDDSPGVSIIPTNGLTEVTEGGSTDTYQLVLTSQPAQNVTITLENVQNQVQARGPSGLSTVTFTPANWNVPQTVTVTAVNDTQVEGDHQTYVSHLITTSDINYGEAFALQELVFIKDNDADITPPRITGVRVGSSAWSSTFRDYLDVTNRAGFLVPTGSSAQLNTLPWSNVDRLYIGFSEDVANSLQASDFAVSMTPGFRSNGTQPPPVSIAGIQVINSRLVEIRLNAPIEPAWIDLKVVSSGVTDAAGNILDGNWVNGGTNTVSGNGSVTDTSPVNGVNPNDFSFRMAFLPGDANPVQNLVVNSTDISRVISKQNEFYIPNIYPGNAASPGYDPKSDLDGNGVINSVDLYIALSRTNSFLNSAPSSGSSNFGFLLVGQPGMVLDPKSSESLKIGPLSNEPAESKQNSLTMTSFAAQGLAYLPTPLKLARWTASNDPTKTSDSKSIAAIDKALLSIDRDSNRELDTLFADLVVRSQRDS